MKGSWKERKTVMQREWTRESVIKKYRKSNIWKDSEKKGRKWCRDKAQGKMLRDI